MHTLSLFNDNPHAFHSHTRIKSIVYHACHIKAALLTAQSHRSPGRHTALSCGRSHTALLGLQVVSV